MSQPSRLLSTRQFIVILGLAALSCTQNPADVEIDRGLVERVITTLAADDMEGRATFSPGIEKAAVFLEDEFERLGLEKLDGLDSYRQAFSMYSITPTSSTVQLNGKTIDSADVFSMTGSPSVSWTEADDISVTRVAADDDFSGAFGGLRRSTTPTIVLIDTAHRELFARYQSFLARPQQVMSPDNSGTVVFILTNESEASTYAVELRSTVEELPLANIAGMIRGHRANEYVVFSGHYDHIGIRDVVEGDSIANGANDDASGTTAVVALADYFKKLAQPERTLLFVAFTAEESGGYGARYFSEQLNPDQIVAMFNIEMIGKPAVEGPNTAWITGFDRSTFGEILDRAVEGTGYTFYADPYPTQNLFFRSDNATLARLGVPAHSISTTPIDVDPDYHQVSDEVETLDMDHMTNTIKAIALGARTIVSGEETPTRVVIEE